MKSVLDELMRLYGNPNRIDVEPFVPVNPFANRSVPPAFNAESADLIPPAGPNIQQDVPAPIQPPASQASSSPDGAPAGEPEQSWLMKYYLSLGEKEVPPVVNVNSSPNKEADLSSNPDDGADPVQVAAQSANPPLSKAAPIPASAAARTDNKNVKMNDLEMGTAGKAQPSTPARLRMRDIDGGKTERPRMSEGEETAALREQDRTIVKDAATEKQNPAINKEGRDFVIWQETQGKPFAPTIYLDPNKIPTIGYGHRVFKGENFPQALTREDAERLFEKDLKERVEPSLKKIEVPLTQAQVNALADYIYNRGGKNFSDKVLPDLNAGNYDKIPGIIAADVGNPPLPGNVRRRREEADLFAGKTLETK